MLVQETRGTIVHPIQSRVNYRESKDGENIKKNCKELLQQFTQISSSLGLDGVTNFGQRNRRCVIKIKRTAATSKTICWRRVIVRHDMVHALHYFKIILGGASADASADLSEDASADIFD